jgi:hypothetical protein
MATGAMTEAARWRLWRWCYYAGLGALFAGVGFYVGPNYIMFGKLTWLSPADFVPTVQRECLPVVQAMKAYQRDHGRLPDRPEELVPDYLPAVDPMASVWNGKFEYWTSFNHRIEYTFGPGDEGWRVEGVFVTGRIPLPPVTAGPSSRAATHPATQRG